MTRVRPDTHPLPRILQKNRHKSRYRLKLWHQANHVGTREDEYRSLFSP